MRLHWSIIDNYDRIVRGDSDDGGGLNRAFRRPFPPIDKVDLVAWQPRNSVKVPAELVIGAI